MPRSEDEIFRYLRSVVGDRHDDRTSARTPKRIRAAIGLCVISIAAYASVSMSAAGWGPTGRVSREIVGSVVIVFAVAGGGFVVRGLPRRTRALSLVALGGDILFVLALASFTDAGEALIGVALLGVIGFLFVFFLSDRALAAHLVIVAIAVAVFAALARLDGLSICVVAARSTVVTLTAFVLPFTVRLVWIRAWSIARDSEIDPLTRVLNRRGLDTRAKFRVARLPPGAALAVAVIDLDRFKLVNDEYGHAAGDDVLRRVGELLVCHVDRAGVVARTGGEEFTVVVTGDRDTVGTLMRTVPTRVDAGGSHPAVTASVGVALTVYSEDAGSERGLVADLCSLADSAMYSAKRAGGQRIHWSTGETSGPEAVSLAFDRPDDASAPTAQFLTADAPPDQRGRRRGSTHCRRSA